MNFLNRLYLATTSFYLRRSPIPLGRWRLLNQLLPILREHGKELGERVVKTRYRFQYIADLGDWLGQFVYLTGVYEPPTAQVIFELLKPGDTFIDVGANSGFFTLLASRRVGSAGRVLSFEPVPSMRKRLLANISLNAMGNVIAHDVALSNTEGTLPLYEGPEGHKGISSLRHIDNAALTIEVEIRPLDTFKGDLSELKLVKIDVEGAEQMVLEGMSDIINTHHPYIVIEITDDYLRAFGHTATQLADHLVEKGYRMYAIRDTGLVPMQPGQAADDDQFNALFAYTPVPGHLVATQNDAHV